MILRYPELSVVDAGWWSCGWEVNGATQTWRAFSAPPLDVSWFSLVLAWAAQAAASRANGRAALVFVTAARDSRLKDWSAVARVCQRDSKRQQQREDGREVRASSRDHRAHETPTAHDGLAQLD